MNNSAHTTFGPYIGCRYVGRPQEPEDVQVWLLYDDLPHQVASAPVGVLYNRWRHPGMDRTDRWIARAHGPRHHHDGADTRNFPADTTDQAITNLWKHLHRDEPGDPDVNYSAALAAFQAQGIDPASGCNH